MRAGSMPPITSTTTSMSGSLTIDSASVVRMPGASSTGRSLAGAAHRDPRHLEPQARARGDGVALLVDELDERAAHVAAPEQADLDRGAVHTIHRTYSVQADKVVKRLAPDDDPRLAVAHEHHRRPRHLVVVRRHRVAVGAGDRRAEHVADREVGGHAGVAHDDVARLAVLAHDRDDARPRRRAWHAGRNAS